MSIKINKISGLRSLFLILVLTGFSSQIFANIVKVKLESSDNCSGQLDLAIFLKSSDLASTNSFRIGSSSIFLNFNPSVISYASHTTHEFSANTSTQAAGANWIDQSLGADNSHGLLNIVLQKEPGGTGDYYLNKNDWVHVATVTFNWNTPSAADPSIKLHDKFTMFNAPANDGIVTRDLEDFPIASGWDNCSCVGSLSLNSVHPAGTNIIYRAGNTIEDTDIINSGATIECKAGGSVRLNNGFHAKPGAYFKAQIEPCAGNGGGN